MKIKSLVKQISFICCVGVYITSSFASEHAFENENNFNHAPDYSENSKSAPVIYLDQGWNWTNMARKQFYTQDQGSQFMPLSWLKALREPNNLPFLRDSLHRYGFLPNPDKITNPQGLPVGFTAAKAQGTEYVGVNCAACHTREIKIKNQSYRIDGGPAITNLHGFLTDLDNSMSHLLNDPKAYAAFERRVLGHKSRAVEQVNLRKELTTWYEPFHMLTTGALSNTTWGFGRADAIGFAMDQITGTDIGTPENNYLIPENIVPADAPVRFPFLWNAALQDRSNWPGTSPNGNEFLRLSAALSEVYGIFASFHPVKDQTLPLQVDYLKNNSANFIGLLTLDTLVQKIGAPKWQWGVNESLAQKGKTIYETNCTSCHGITEGVKASPTQDTWATPILNVETDTREWDHILSKTNTGVLLGAPKISPTGTYGDVDDAFTILSTTVLGTILQKFPALDSELTFPSTVSFGEPGSYEARVLQGVWAAAPYLHNGSVPNLVELLKPAVDRVKVFKVGSNYDINKIGLAAEQSQLSSVTHTTDCSDLNSGNSNCGHEYGTTLSKDSKKALLEYMKTL